MGQTDVSDSVVVYYYADPSYPGDMAPTIDTLRKRGFRVVKGDNADELLFLLQVGRPAAVIYTLASKKSKSYASYQMVTRRALDLLVPLILVGPEEPRDGAMLVYPQGKEVLERHIPYHSIPDLIAQFDEKPPSTPSRPPSVLHKQTMGKGRTILNWRGGSPMSVPPEASSAHEKPKASTILSANMGSEKARETMPARKSGVGRGAVSQPPSSADFAGGTQMGLPSTPPPISDLAESLEPQNDDDLEIKSTAAMFAESTHRVKKVEGETAEQETQTSGPSILLFVVGAAAAVALAVIAIVIYVTINNSEQQSGVVLPVGNLPVATELETELPTLKPSAAVPTEELPELVMPDKVQAEVDIPESATKQREKHRPLEDAPEGDAMPFPAHFRSGTATFWFADGWDEERFIELLQNRREGTKIKIIGHPTNEDISQSRGGIGTSRAWAVEKYLIRKGFSEDALETYRGKPVSEKADMDEKGWARNRWVDIMID